MSMPIWQCFEAVATGAGGDLHLEFRVRPRTFFSIICILTALERPLKKDQIPSAFPAQRNAFPAQMLTTPALQRRMRQSPYLEMAVRGLSLLVVAGEVWYGLQISWAIGWLLLELALLILLWLLAAAFLVLHAIFWDPSLWSSCLMSLFMSEPTCIWFSAYSCRRFPQRYERWLLQADCAISVST